VIFVFCVIPICRKPRCHPCWLYRNMPLFSTSWCNIFIYDAFVCLPFEYCM